MVHEQKEFDRLVAAFFGTVHDMKNVMNGIVGFTTNTRDMALDGELNAAEIIAHSNMVLQGVTKMDKLLLDFLSFAKDEPRKTLVDITELIKTEIDSASVIAGDIRVILGSTEDRLLYIDENQIGSVMRELLHNAIHISKENGGKEITVQTYFYDKKERHSLCIEVRNQGHIPEADLEKVFRLSYTTRAGGSGVGLTAARKAVEMHGGRIKCDNDGDSVVFKVYLPRSIS